MYKTKIYKGDQLETPWFDVYLCALRGPKAFKFTLQAAHSDKAVDYILAHENAPFSAFVAVYRCDPTPKVSGKYGEPMGRGSDNLSMDDLCNYRARKIQLDSGGCDKGGAYWGLRINGGSLYCVEDGDGNLGFYEAKNGKDAIRKATE